MCINSIHIFNEYKAGVFWTPHASNKELSDTLTNVTEWYCVPIWDRYSSRKEGRGGRRRRVS